MARALARAGRDRPGLALLIGSDIPDAAPAALARAARAMGGAELALGPAADGGFWLVGARHGRLPPGIFAGVRWSAPETLSDVLANLRGRRVAFADRLSDVDRAADLPRRGFRPARS